MLPPRRTADDDLIERAVHDALLGRLARAPRLRVHARSSAADAAGAYVVTLSRAAGS